MKTVILNASPRKNANTAKLLHAAMEGALAKGNEVSYYDLYDLNFMGCRSCLACKRKGTRRCHCYWNDSLSPVLDEIFEADALIVGSPIYLGDVSAALRSLLERLHFCCLSYDNYENYFKGKVKTAVILTMNATKMYFELAYRKAMKERLRGLGVLNSEMELLPCFDTLQVDDYSKYDMSSFDEEHKKKVHAEKFPEDLKKAYELGERL